MAETRPLRKSEEKASSKAYYEKVNRESKEALVSAVPSIALGVISVILLWLFGNLIFIPISQGIVWDGYPLTQILTFVIMIGMAIFLMRILGSVRQAVDALAGLAACEIGAPYDVTTEEVDHYKTALRGILYVVIVSLAFMLFSDYLTLIHPALSGVVLITIVAWAIYQIYTAVKAISEEIKRYSANWTGKALK